MGWQIPRVEYGPEWKPRSWLDLEVEGHPSFASSSHSHRESGGWWVGSAATCYSNSCLLFSQSSQQAAARGPAQQAGAAEKQGQLKVTRYLCNL